MPATPLGGRRERVPGREACLLRGNAASENTTVLGLPLHWFPKTERACGMRGTVRTGRCRETTLVRPQLGKSRPRGRRGPESGSREAGWAGPGRVSVGLGLALSRTGSQRPHLGQLCLRCWRESCGEWLATGATTGARAAALSWLFLPPAQWLAPRGRLRGTRPPHTPHGPVQPTFADLVVHVH